MRDTSPDVARRYRDMLLRRSGAARLRMAASMFTTARALAAASLRAEEPGLSAAALRRGLFLRLYGADFEPEARERILARLETSPPGEDASPPRVPVDWDDLGMALTANGDEWTCYLDRRSGEVHMVPIDRLDDDAEPTDDEIEAGLAAGDLIAIEPIGSSVEYGWMAEFDGSVADRRLRDRLGAALDGRGAFRRFNNVLLDAPAERDRWFALRDGRLREVAREWRVDHGIEATTRSWPRA